MRTGRQAILIVKGAVSPEVRHMPLITAVLRYIRGEVD